MKKSTGLLILLTFFVILLVLVAVFVSLMVFLLQGTTPSLDILRGNRLALVRVENVIYDAEDWIKQIEKYQKDQSISAIVLRVNSPGGAVGPSQELYDAVKTASEEYGKIVVASFGSVAASGGYYIACGADHIVSAPGTLTGSIGVYSQFLQAQKLMEKIGIDYETVKAGEYKTAGSMHRDLTPKERDMFEGIIGDTYDQFLEAIIEGRREQLVGFLHHPPQTDYVDQYPFTSDVMGVINEYQDARSQARQEYMERKADQAESQAAADAANSATLNVQSATGTVSSDTVADASPEEHTESAENTANDEFQYEPDDETVYRLTKALANGKIYTGRQAKQLSLVDSLGTLDDAIDIAAKMAGIRGEPTIVEKKKPELTFWDLLSSQLRTFTQKQSAPPLMYKFEY